jgi:tetratricopeptide (TPR) repeat protein
LVQTALADSLVQSRQYSEAEEADRQALQLCSYLTPSAGGPCPHAVQSLALVLRLEGKLAQAESFLLETLAQEEGAPGKPNAAIVGALLEMPELARAQAREGNVTQAEKLFENAIAFARQKLGETNVVLGELLHNYGDFLSFEEHQPKAATVQYLQALPIRRPAQDDNLAWTLRNLAAATHQATGPEEAVPYLREALEVYHRLHKREDLNNSIRPAIELADCLYQRQHLPEAESAYRAALIACRQCGPAGREELARAVRSLLEVLKREHKLLEGEALCQETLSQNRAAAPKDLKLEAETLSTLAENLISQRRLAEAQTASREALRIFQQSAGLNPDRWEDRTQIGHLQWQLAQILRESHRFAEAEKLLRQGSQVFEKASRDFPREHFIRQEHAYSEWLLGELMVQANRPEQGVAAFQRSLAVLQKSMKDFPDQKALMERGISVGIELADLLTRMQRYSEAADSFRAALLICSKHTAEGGDQCDAAVESLVRVLRLQNKMAE